MAVSNSNQKHNIDLTQNAERKAFIITRKFTKAPELNYGVNLDLKKKNNLDKDTGHNASHQQD